MYIPAKQSPKIVSRPALHPMQPTTIVRLANRCQNQNRHFHWCEIDPTVAIYSMDKNKRKWNFALIFWINMLIRHFFFGLKSLKNIHNLQMMYRNRVHRRKWYCLRHRWQHLLLLLLQSWRLVCVFATLEADSLHSLVLCLATCAKAMTVRLKAAVETVTVLDIVA